MMKNVTLLICVFLFTGFTYAQDVSLEWANSIGGARWDTPTDIAADNQGNLYTTGFFSDTVDFDHNGGVYELISEGVEDIGPRGGANGYVRKLDANGNLLWAINHLSGDLNSPEIHSNKIEVDPSGNVFVLSGSVNSTVDLDPSSNTFYINEAGTFKVLHKFDSNGNLIWVLHVSAGDHLKVDTTGDIYISGVYPTGTIDIDPGAGVYNISHNIPTTKAPFLAKLSGATGDLIWGANFAHACTGSAIKAMEISPTGDVAIGGYYKNQIDADPGPGYSLLSASNQTDRNGFVIELDINGNLASIKNYTVPGNWSSDVLDLGYDDSDNLYVLAIGLNPNIYSTQNGIFKYNPFSSTYWLSEIPNYFLNIEMDVKADASIYLWGQFPSSTDLDPDPNNTYYVTTSLNKSSFVCKWDGTPTTPTTGSNPIFEWGIDLDHDFDTNNSRRLLLEKGLGNDLFFSTAFEGTYNADWGSGTYNLTAGGCPSYCQDILTQKMNTCPGSSYEVVEVNLCVWDSYTFPSGTTEYFSSPFDSIAIDTFTLANGCDSIIETVLTVGATHNQVTVRYACEGTDYTYPDGIIETITANSSHTSFLTTEAGCDSTIYTQVIMEIAPAMTAHYSCDIGAVILTVTDMGTYQGNPSPAFDVVVPDGPNNSQTTTISSAGAYNVSYQLNNTANQSWRISIFEPNNCSPDYWVYPDCYEVPCGEDAQEMVSNGTFESTAPTYWAETVTFLDGVTETGYSILYNTLGFNNSARAAWLGGLNEGSINNIEQYVSFPQSQGVTELVWWDREDGACQPDDVFTVSIDGTVIYTRTSDNNPNCGDGNWHLRTINVSAYADGNTHLLNFAYTQQGTNGYTNLFLDDVSIQICDCSYFNTDTFIHCSADDFTFPDGSTQTNITSDLTHYSNLINAEGCDSTIVTELVINEPVQFTTSYDCETDIITIDVTDVGLSGNPATASAFTMDVGGVTYSIPGTGSYIFPANPNQSWRFDVNDDCTDSQVVYTDDCLETTCSIDKIESIANGDFEDAINNDWVTTTSYVDGSPRIFDIINTNYVYHYPDEFKSAHFGADFNEYQGTVSSISQNITIPAGINSTLSWWQYERWTCSSDDNLSIYIDNDLVYSLNSDQNTYCNSYNWSYQTVDLSAYSGDGLVHNFSIIYTQPNTNGTSRLHMDNISIETCPCESSNNQVTASICSGDDYTFPDGSTQTGIIADVTQTSVITSPEGCTATTVTQLTVLPNTSRPPLFTYVCEGDNYTYADGTVSTNITANESQISVIPNQYGCDSTILEIISVQSNYNVEGDIWICEYQIYQKHIYVDDTATGNNDGTSWNDAFTDLQDALALAATETFYHVHVAEGIYYPTSSTQRGIAFELPQRTTLLGGYPNNGGTRDPAANETILSGNVDGVPSKDGNSYHVVLIKDVQIVTLDGFTVRDGNADNANSFGRSRGGGIYCKGSSSIIIDNCEVKWNKALYGGGIFATLSSPVQLNNSSFKNNRANYGSAIFHSNETYLYLDGTTITNNTSDIRAAIEINNSSYTRLINTVIANNVTANSNAISFVATNRDQSCDIYNSTITGEEKNKNLISMLIGFGDQLDVNIYNSIIAHQNANFDKAFVAYQNGILNLNTDHCYLTGTSVLGTSNGNLYTGTDGALVLNNDYSLPSNSLGIDAGDDALVLPYYTTDINGADRILGNAVDMGAFEYSATSSRETLDNEIDKVATFSTKVYPNPASDELNIRIEGKEEASIQANLFSVNGQLLQSKKQEAASNEVLKMDVSSLPSGIYFLHVKVGDSIHTERVIIQD